MALKGAFLSAPNIFRPGGTPHSSPILRPDSTRQINLQTRAPHDAKDYGPCALPVTEPSVDHPQVLREKSGQCYALPELPIWAGGSHPN